MAKKKINKKEPTFEVRFKGPNIDLEEIPLRAVGDALSAVQDLASGRDPYETQKVPPEKSIGLVKVRRGSAVYVCFAHAASEAMQNLARVGVLLSPQGSNGNEIDDGLVAALKPIESLSSVAKQLGCRVEVRPVGDKNPIFVVTRDDYDKVSKQLLLEGETTVAGKVQRVGGATEMRWSYCQLLCSAEFFKRRIPA